MQYKDGDLEHISIPLKEALDQIVEACRVGVQKWHTDHDQAMFNSRVKFIMSEDKDE